MPNENFVTQDVMEKINTRFNFMRIGWYIFYAIILSFIIYVVTVIIEDTQSFSDIYLLKRYFILFCGIIIFFLSTKLEKYISEKVEKNFIIGIISKNEFEYELRSINGEEFHFFCSQKNKVRQAADYATSWFIYRTIVRWPKGLEKVFQINLSKRKLHIIPAFFNDVDSVYIFLSKISVDSVL